MTKMSNRRMRGSRLRRKRRRKCPICNKRIGRNHNGQPCEAKK